MKLCWKIIKVVVFILLSSFCGWFEDSFYFLREYFEKKAENIKTNPE